MSRPGEPILAAYFGAVKHRCRTCKVPPDRWCLDHLGRVQRVPHIVRLKDAGAAQALLPATPTNDPPLGFPEPTEVELPPDWTPTMGVTSAVETDGKAQSCGRDD